MILSTKFLEYYLIKYNNENIREYYNKNQKKQLMTAIMLYIGILFLIMELVLFMYALKITMKISKNNNELIVFSILSITFTTPFIFFMILTNQDARNALV
jgi:predicted transporter